MFSDLPYVETNPITQKFQPCDFNAVCAATQSALPVEGSAPDMIPSDLSLLFPISGSDQQVDFAPETDKGIFCK